MTTALTFDDHTPAYAGNFSDALRFPCKGCQDGYLTEALVTQRFWSYVQLPIDGMQSMVFHGPSPTLCIASGESF
jgi:hypothetical protein